MSVEPLEIGQQIGQGRGQWEQREHVRHDEVSSGQVPAFPPNLFISLKREYKFREGDHVAEKKLV